MSKKVTPKNICPNCNHSRWKTVTKNKRYQCRICKTEVMDREAFKKEYPNENILE